MSEDYYIGLSRSQVEKLLKGEEVGKRAYYEPVGNHPSGKVRYKNIRIHVKMLLNIEELIEPESAFEW